MTDTVSTIGIFQACSMSELGTALGASASAGTLPADLTVLDTLLEAEGLESVTLTDADWLRVRSCLGHVPLFASKDYLMDKVRRTLMFIPPQAAPDQTAWQSLQAAPGESAQCDPDRGYGYAAADSPPVSHRFSTLDNVLKRKGEAVVIDASEAAADELPAVFALWSQLSKPEVGRDFSALSLQLPFRMRFDLKILPGTEGQLGTVIDMGEGTPEQIVEILQYYKPVWFEGTREDRWGWRPQTPVRVILPDDLAPRILDWSMRETLAVDARIDPFYDLLGKAYDGEILSADDQKFLADAQAWGKANQTRFGLLGNFWKNIFELQLEDAATGSYQRPLPVGQALHDIWTLGSGMYVLAHGFRHWLGGYRERRERPELSQKESGTLGYVVYKVARVHLEADIKIDEPSRELLRGFSLREDPEQLVKITHLFANLFTNARRYAHPDRPLEVVVSAEQLPAGSLLITVRDNGIGIRPENISRLGTAGFREGRKEVEGSQGIGLSSVVATLREVGSPLWVQSREGEGSAFRFMVGVDSADLNKAVRDSALEDIPFQVASASLRGELLKTFESLYTRGNHHALDAILIAAANENEEAQKTVAQLEVDRRLDNVRLAQLGQQGAYDALLFLTMFFDGNEGLRNRVGEMDPDPYIRAFRRGWFKDKEYLALAGLIKMIEFGGNGKAVLALRDLVFELDELKEVARQLDATMLLKRLETDPESPMLNRAVLAFLLSRNPQVFSWIDSGGKLDMPLMDDEAMLLKHMFRNRDEPPS